MPRPNHMDTVSAVILCSYSGLNTFFSLLRGSEASANETPIDTLLLNSLVRDILV
jgi:hypothetical protein